MSAELSGRVEHRPVAPSALFRHMALVLLPVAEIAWLTFDAQARRHFDLLARTSVLSQIAIACAAAIGIVGVSRLHEIGRRLVDFAAEFRGRALALGCHLCSVAVVVWLVHRDAPLGGVEDAVGAAAFAAATGFWGLALAPYRFWRQLWSDDWPAILGGAAAGICAWAVGRSTQALWRPLGEATFVVVEQILKRIYPQIVSDRAEQLVGTPEFPIIIAPECSGYEGIGLMVVFLTVFFWMFRDRLRFPQAWLLWPAAIAAIWLLNAVRIALLVIVGTSFSPGVATRGFHSQAGWLFFNLAAFALMTGALRLRFFSVCVPVAVTSQSASQAAAYLVPGLSLIAVNMLMAAVSDGSAFDRLYPLKTFVVAAILWRFRDAWQRLEWGWSWHAIANGCIVFAIWLATAQPPEAGAGALGETLSRLSSLEAALWLAFRVLGSVVLVPLAEELAYRGYLLRRLVSTDFDRVDYRQTTWWGAVVSSVAFGLMHDRWIAGTAAGLFYVYAARRRNNLADAVLAHATTNFLIACDVLLFGAWWLW